jgi:hypothetical protein
MNLAKLDEERMRNLDLSHKGGELVGEDKENLPSGCVLVGEYFPSSLLTSILHVFRQETH